MIHPIVKVGERYTVRGETRVVEYVEACRGQGYEPARLPATIQRPPYWVAVGWRHPGSERVCRCWDFEMAVFARQAGGPDL